VAAELLSAMGVAWRCLNGAVCAPSAWQARAQPEASDSDGEADTPAPPSWDQHPETAAAVIVHHESILRLKRVLLAYTCVPMLPRVCPRPLRTRRTEGLGPARAGAHARRRKERRNRIKQLRWQQRSLPACVAPNLSPAEKEARPGRALAPLPACAGARVGALSCQAQPGRAPRSGSMPTTSC